MRKKTLSVVLGAAMAASLLSGCGGASKPADATTAAPAAETTAAPAADTTAAPRLTQRLLQPMQHLPIPDRGRICPGRS